MKLFNGMIALLHTIWHFSLSLSLIIMVTISVYQYHAKCHDNGIDCFIINANHRSICDSQDLYKAAVGRGR